MQEHKTQHATGTPLADVGPLTPEEKGPAPGNEWGDAGALARLPKPAAAVGPSGWCWFSLYGDGPPADSVSADMTQQHGDEAAREVELLGDFLLQTGVRAALFFAPLARLKSYRKFSR